MNARSAALRRNSPLLVHLILGALTMFRATDSAKLPIAITLLLTAGCTLGPDFLRPAAPDVSYYTATPLSTTVNSTNVIGGEAQRFAKGSDISADWWSLFHSKPL